MSQDQAVRELTKAGYAFPCTCCIRMWRAKAKGFTDCSRELPPGKNCGGPMAGMSFPLYIGPLTREAIAMSCLRCGKRAVEAVSSTQNPDLLVGACEEHKLIFDRLIPDESLTRRMVGT